MYNIFKIKLFVCSTNDLNLSAYFPLEGECPFRIACDQNTHGLISLSICLDISLVGDVSITPIIEPIRDYPGWLGLRVCSQTDPAADNARVFQ